VLEDLGLITRTAAGTARMRQSFHREPGGRPPSGRGTDGGRAATTEVEIREHCTVKPALDVGHDETICPDDFSRGRVSEAICNAGEHRVGITALRNTRTDLRYEKACTAAALFEGYCGYSRRWIVLLIVVGIVACLSSVVVAQAVVRRHSGAFPESLFGNRMAAGRDLSGDGIGDYVVTDAAAAGIGKPALQAFSGATGELLWQDTFPVPFCSYGTSVEIIDDLSADGRADVLVGISGCNFVSGAPQPGGSVRVCSGADGGLIRLHTGNAISGDAYGSLVRAVGDLTGDGVPEYVVRASYGDGSLQAPEIWLYDGATGANIWAAYAPTAPGSWYGRAIAAVGDYDGDGFGDFAVAAPRESTASFFENGTIRVYGAFLQAPILVIEGSASGEFLGLQLASIDDQSGDGKRELACTVIHGVKIVTSNLPLQPHLLIANPPGYQLGRVMCATDDLNGDGADDLLVGQWSATTTNHGAWVVDAITGEVLYKRLDVYSTSIDNLVDFPLSIGSIGDIDSDGRPEWAIGHGLAKAESGKRGVVEVISVAPLHAHSAAVVPGAKKVAFSLSGGLKNAGRPYFLVASASGTAGINLPLSVLPLTYDFFFDASIIMANTRVFQNTFGHLDPLIGNASSMFDGTFLPLAADGKTLHFAYAVFDASGDWSSNALSFPIDLNAGP